jgi:prevent-host-death family protein
MTMDPSGSHLASLQLGHRDCLQGATTAAWRRGRVFDVEQPTYHDHDRSVPRGTKAMPTIRPISDLRNKSHEIGRFCHETGEPVFITKNGEGNLVVMGVAAYERDRARLELYALLDEAEGDVKAGDRGIGLRAMRKRLRER